MIKITPQDYIDAQDQLIGAGFRAIQDMLYTTKGDVASTAKTYGVSEEVVEIVKTTHNYDQFETTVRLETERAEAVAKTEAMEREEQERQNNLYQPSLRRQPTTIHYIIAVAILALIVYLLYFALDGIISLVVGGF